MTHDYEMTIMKHPGTRRMGLPAVVAALVFGDCADQPSVLPVSAG